MNIFLHRAAQYADLDRKLRTRTRFFAAASLTNQMLERLSAPCDSGWSLATECREFLEQVASGTESFALSLAPHIVGSPRRAAFWDPALVKLEQTHVQHRLQYLQSLAPAGHALTLVVLDRLINPRHLESVVVKGWPGGELYLTALQQVRERLGRRLQFCLQSDRELIGRALIEVIRSRGNRAAALDLAPPSHSCRGLASAQASPRRAAGGPDLRPCIELPSPNRRPAEPRARRAHAVAARG